MIEYEKVIRDPIYGYIGISKEQLKLIELPVFQRLRRISQLSFADLVYPNANHNRFSHSIGVMRLGQIVSEYLIASGLDEQIGLSREDCQLITWAALLHDIGHLPFSHVCEPAFAYYINNSNNWKDYHVDLGCRIIKNPDFGIVDIIGKETAEKVCQLIKGEDDLSRHLVEIMTGICSIDRLDYLKRDAYHAGTPEYAIIDAERILKSLITYPKDPYIAPVFKKKARYALEGVVLSYFYMYRAIYYHRAVRAAYLLFQDIIWNAFENYDLKTKLGDILSPDFWYHFDDHYLLTVLRQLHKDIRVQIEKLVFRKLPKLIPPEKLWGENVNRIFRFFGERVTFKEKVEKEREIAEKLENFGVEKIFLDSPMVIPYPRSLLAEGGIYVWDENGGEPQNIGERSPHILTLPDAAEKELAARIYVLPQDLRSDEHFIEELNKVIMEVIR